MIQTHAAKASADFFNAFQWFCNGCSMWLQALPVSCASLDAFLRLPGRLHWPYVALPWGASPGPSLASLAGAFAELPRSFRRASAKLPRKSVLAPTRPSPRHAFSPRWRCRKTAAQLSSLLLPRCHPCCHASHNVLCAPPVKLMRLCCHRASTIR